MTLTAAVALIASSAAPQTAPPVAAQAQAPAAVVPTVPAAETAPTTPTTAELTSAPVTSPASTDPTPSAAASVMAEGAAPSSATSPADAPCAADQSPAAQSGECGAVASASADDESPEIIVTAREASPGDPLEKLNVQSFKTVQAVDKAVLEPVAVAYNKGLPIPARKGLRNFFSNLNEPIVFVAYLLQFKPGKAVETVGRFGLNTTLGIGGLFDVAKRKPFNLPHRQNGLANVLGFYGVGPGPYMYLPIIGPTTLRDVIGDTVDKLILPAAIGSPFTKPAVVIPMTILNQLGERAAFDEQIRDIRDSSDPYGTYRELYLRQRKAEIEALHGRITPDVAPVYGSGLRVAGDKKK